MRKSVLVTHAWNLVYMQTTKIKFQWGQNLKTNTQYKQSRPIQEPVKQNLNP